jgi:RNA polymerase sigma-70 factor (ECF subfamily)
VKAGLEEQHSGMASPSGPPDESLVTRMAAHDQEALSSLYDRHRRVIYALALRVLRDAAEAEEVLTDVFLQAWRHAPGYDRSRGSVPAWLINLCRSRAIDRLRARGRREAAHSALAREDQGRAAAPSKAGDGPEEEADLALKRRRIEAALGALSASQRQAIELAYYGGLSHTEIAERLGEPLGTVKTRIRQGLLTLRESLGAQFEG